MGKLQLGIVRVAWGFYIASLARSSRCLLEVVTPVRALHLLRVLLVSGLVLRSSLTRESDNLSQVATSQPVASRDIFRILVAHPFTRGGQLQTSSKQGQMKPD